MDRGILTDDMKEKYGITVKELRLLPYFQYLLMNSEPVDSRKIDSEERTILQKWRDEGKITFSMSEPCNCTLEFWNWMNEILWESYVPHYEEESEE